MASRSRIYCLDSWAVLRFLEGSSDAARRVRHVMRLGRPIMSWINLGEVYYTITRQFAVGGGARFSRAADDVETGTDQFVSIKTGGLQVGVGVRFLF